MGYLVTMATHVSGGDRANRSTTSAPVTRLPAESAPPGEALG
jgi:hypothetical protein